MEKYKYFVRFLLFLNGSKNVDKEPNFLLCFCLFTIITFVPGGCFSSSSRVVTQHGPLKISNLKLNDFVLTYTQGFGLHYTEVNF